MLVGVPLSQKCNPEHKPQNRSMLHVSVMSSDTSVYYTHLFKKHRIFFKFLGSGKTNIWVFSILKSNFVKYLKI